MPLPADSAGASVDASSRERHEHAVSSIAKSVQGFYARRQPYRIYHGSTNSTRRAAWSQGEVVDTSGLTRVLSVDRASMTALVEPNVPMDALVAETTRHGLVPPVIMEFPGITAGGGFSGTSAESSSFKAGIFDQTVDWIEVVLANGDIVTASKHENPDLLRGAASAFGTLGVVTLLQFRLVDAPRYVALRYEPVVGIDGALKAMEVAAARPEVTYLDGILFSPTTGVVCIGTGTDTLPPSTKPTTFSKRWDPWFHLRAQAVLKKHPAGATDYVPLADYLFRYDRGGFWVARYSFRYFFMPFNRLTRAALHPLLHARVMYHALHKSGLADKYVLQDVAVPTGAAPQLHDYVRDSFGQYPLWLCPLRAAQDAPPFHGYAAHADEADVPADTAPPFARMLLNFGVWGPAPGRAGRDRRAFVEHNRALERKVRELGGLKCLYAHAYYTEAEFWEIFDREGVDALRRRFHAEYLPTVFDKVKVDVDEEERREQATGESRWRRRVKGVWPVAGVYGVVHALLRKDYLMKKEKKQGKAVSEKEAVNGA